MITGTISDPGTGAVIYNMTFSGFEFFLGSILGALAAVVVWSTLKSFGK